MNPHELLELIEIEIADIDLTADFVDQLLRIIGSNQPDVFQKAAITQFVAQFYNGIENILKNLCKDNAQIIPYGAHSHIELFNLFIDSNAFSNPVLFTNSIKDDFIGIRQFRHFAIHGYAFKIEWEYIKPSVERIGDVYAIFKGQLSQYLDKENQNFF